MKRFPISEYNQVVTDALGGVVGANSLQIRMSDATFADAQAAAKADPERTTYAVTDYLVGPKPSGIGVVADALVPNGFFDIGVKR